MTGEDILTRFEITEGKIHSAVESLRKEILEELYGVSAAVHLSDALYIALQFLWLIGILFP